MWSLPIEMEASVVELDQVKYSLLEYEKPLEEMEASLSVDSKLERIKEIERNMEEPNFWDDAASSASMVQELKTLKGSVESIAGLKQAYEDILTLIEMAEEENDASLVPEVQAEFAQFEEEYADLRTETLLSEEFDHENAIVTLHAGAGGTESCDWAGMLYRMYQHWVNKKGYGIEILDWLDGEEAGIKSVTFQVNGASAYGYLKSEHGVHRLVRISPFNAAGKRQTSFVSCDVMPDIEDDINVEINMDDLRIDTYRSSGAGGQHINKTSSAIRITHLPTGIVVQCQNERSQFQNKDKAMQMLKAKLFLLEKQKQADYAAGIRGDVKDINFGSQIRSYVLQPYTMVKDHRTGVEIGNAQSVLDGNLDPFINGYLSWVANGCKSRDDGDI